ncbi:MAG: hypothetical protein J5967_03510 [Oscillospiraceae bacterium]|nr:hypothetical protein [Oscillospiraceae bacterium]
MRNTEEQLREIMRRAETVKETRRVQKQLRTSALASCVCILLPITVSVYIPRLTAISQDAAAGQYGSLLLAAPYMGYAVVGVLAFALGVCVTLFSLQWRTLREKERDLP